MPACTGKNVKPKDYFFCESGGALPLCSDCIRNHSKFRVQKKDIQTWLAPRLFIYENVCKDYVEID